MDNILSTILLKDMRSTVGNDNDRSLPSSNKNTDNNTTSEYDGPDRKKQNIIPQQRDIFNTIIKKHSLHSIKMLFFHNPYTNKTIDFLSHIKHLFSTGRMSTSQYYKLLAIDDLQSLREFKFLRIEDLNQIPGGVAISGTSCCGKSTLLEKICGKENVLKVNQLIHVSNDVNFASTQAFCYFITSYFIQRYNNFAFQDRSYIDNIVFQLLAILKDTLTTDEQNTMHPFSHIDALLKSQSVNLKMLTHRGILILTDSNEQLVADRLQVRSLLTQSVCQYAFSRDVAYIRLQNIIFSYFAETLNLFHIDLDILRMVSSMLQVNFKHYFHEQVIAPLTKKYNTINPDNRCITRINPNFCQAKFEFDPAIVEKMLTMQSR